MEGNSKERREVSLEVTDFFFNGSEERELMLAQPEDDGSSPPCSCGCTTRYSKPNSQNAHAQ